MLKRNTAILLTVPGILAALAVAAIPGKGLVYAAMVIITFVRWIGF
jgi:ABC-type dipeptide/oligopeptide/nickel transport system permease subunit